MWRTTGQWELSDYRARVLGPAVVRAAGPGREERVEWGYHGPGAPQNWALLSDDYVTCGKGRRQSPIDIPENGTRRESLDEARISFSYGGDSQTIRHDGRTVQVDFGKGNTLRIDGCSYRLESAHLHSPSEHLIGGRGFAAELHMVHRDANGAVMVLGRLFEPGPPDAVVQAILRAAPRSDSPPVNRPVVQAGAFVPDRLDHYRYRGSLTTPPCHEPVEWYILSERRTLSTEQVAHLLELSGGPNSRPVQALGDRMVTRVSG